MNRRAPARPTGSRELSIGQGVPCFIPPGSSKRGAKGQVGSQIKNFSFSPFKYNYIYASNGAKLISFFMTVKGEIKCSDFARIRGLSQNHHLFKKTTFLISHRIELCQKGGVLGGEKV